MIKKLGVLLGVSILLGSLLVGCQSGTINDLEKRIETLETNLNTITQERDDLKKEVQTVSAKNQKFEDEKAQKEAEVRVQEEDVTIQILNKTNIPKNTDEWRFSSRCNFEISITNNTDKEIQGIQGTLDIQDLFGVSILSSGCDLVGNVIKPGETIINNDMGLEINEFMSEHTKVYSTEYKDLKFEYIITSIVFTDGTVKTN